MQNFCINKKPVMSFCIPTYNRAEKVYKLVLEILKYQGNDIEVVVLDNNSNDKTKHILSSIEDSRLKFYENESNIGGICNVVKSMTKGNGEFVLFCTDKDYINHHNICKLVTFIKNNRDISVGYCTLNINIEKKFKVYDKGIKALKAMAYLSKHPTGYFYKNEYLSSLNILDRFSDSNKVLAYPFEFICAEMCLLGKAAIVNVPLCITEIKEEAKKYKSHTYSNKNGNLFFLPNRKYDLFEKYVNHIYSLNISPKYKADMTKKVLNQELFNATVGFKIICNDADICEHYSMKSRYVGLTELIEHDMKFCSRFIENNFKIKKAHKVWLCCQAQLIIVAKITKIFLFKYIKT